MSRRPTMRMVGCAAAGTLGIAGLETSMAIGLRALLGIRGAWTDALLLFFAVRVLAGAWALRTRLSGDARRAARRATLVPLAALMATVAPRLLFSDAAPGWTLLAATAAVSPLVGLTWRFGAWRTTRADSIERALALGAPLLSLGAVAAATGASHLATLGAIGAITLGGAAFVLHRRAEAVVGAAQRFVARVEVDPDEMRVPVAGSAVPASLLREVQERATVFAAAVSADASARQQIAEARALRTRFMAVMSHELRSPLNSIAGFAQLLERGLEGELTEGQRESATMIRRAADELILLLTDVLDLARLEAGRLKLERRWTPSVEILTEAVTRGNAIVAGREVEIVPELQPGLPPVHVDARRIQQAVLALFRSSAAELRRTAVHVRARIAPGPPGPARQLRVEIHDALGALPQAELDRLFEAFQEISAPTGRRLGGLGMALTLARGLVRLHGGEVWVDAAGGAGARLCVALPLEDL